MAFTVSSLTAWVKQDPNLFYTSAVLGSKTASLIKAQGNVLVGVKNAQTINLVETTAGFAAQACGWSSNATTTLTQRTVTVGSVTIQEALCPATLESYFTSQAMVQGYPNGNPEDMGKALVEKYLEKKMGLTQAQIETALWQGDTSSGTANLARWDGLIKLAKATNTCVLSNARLGTGTMTASSTSSTAVSGTSSAFDVQVSAGDKLYSYNGTTTSTLIGTVSSVTNATTIVLAANAAATCSGTAYYIVPASVDSFAAPYGSTTGITTSNVIAILYGVYNRIPAKLLDKDDLTIFVGMDVIRKYLYALTTANLYHFIPATATGNVLDSMKLHGTNVTLQAVQGLNDTNEIYAMRTSNMFMGVDMLEEEGSYDFFYAKEAREFRYEANFKCGINFAFPDEIVRFQLVAGTLA
jgi:hypothetical protein